MSPKKLQVDSKYAMADTDGDGIITDEEMDRHERWIRLENEDKLMDTQRIMAWLAMSVTIVAVIILFTPIVSAEKMQSAASFLNTFIYKIFTNILYNMLARIEISKNSNIKYEFDEANNSLVLDRILPNSNVFPYNYGYIPNTLAPDGDPVDIILLSSHQLIPGCIIKIRIIGGIETSDEQGQDDKIICVLDEKVDKENNHIKDIDDVTEAMLANIIYFLSHYKDNDGNKFINNSH